MSGIVIGWSDRSDRVNGSLRRRARAAIALGLCAGLVATVAPSVSGASVQPMNGSPRTYWTGNGITSDGANGYVLNSPLCDAESTPYLLFVLAGTKATAATLSIGSSSESMPKSNGPKNGVSSFKYTYTPAGSIDLAALLGGGTNVFATHNDSRNKGTLTVSHGCLGGGNASLTVHFIGELLPSADGPDTWVTLGTNGANQAFKVCETGSTTGCAEFAFGATAGSTRTLTLSGSNKTLDVTVTNDNYYCIAVLLLSDVPVAENFVPSAEMAFSDTPLTSTSTFSNGGDVWFATVCGG